MNELIIVTSIQHKLWLILPGLGKVGPVGNHVARKVTVARPVAQPTAEGFPKHELQVVSMVCSHPAGVRFSQTAQAVGLWEQVGVGTARPTIK